MILTLTSAVDLGSEEGVLRRRLSRPVVLIGRREKKGGVYLEWRERGNEFERVEGHITTVTELGCVLGTDEKQSACDAAKIGEPRIKQLTRFSESQLY